MSNLSCKILIFLVVIGDFVLYNSLSNIHDRISENSVKALHNTKKIEELSETVVKTGKFLMSDSVSKQDCVSCHLESDDNYEIEHDLSKLSFNSVSDYVYCRFRWVEDSKMPCYSSDKLTRERLLQIYEEYKNESNSKNDS